MKNNLLIWQVAGLTFTAVLGTILHFLYEWTNLIFLAPISAVNESTWEHMKLVFIPSFIFGIIQSFVGKREYKSFWFIKLIGALVGTLLIPILFYTLTAFFGRLSGTVNVIIFFVVIFIEYLTEFLLFKKPDLKINLNIISLGILIVTFILFIAFTFYPPTIPLFLDPLTNGYGITK